MQQCYSVEKMKKGEKMDLNKENLKRIRGLIVFTILVFVALWNYKTLYRGIQFLGLVIFPFALGGGIAKERLFLFPSLEEIKPALLSFISKGDAIIFKASRGMRADQLFAAVNALCKNF